MERWGGVFDKTMEKELEGVNEKDILQMPRLFRRSEGMNSGEGEGV